MKRTIPVAFFLAGLLLPGCWATGANAQVSQDAERTLELSVFGGPTATETGLNGGKNAALTAGADVGFHAFRSPLGRLTPSLEIRATYPFDKGHIDSQKNILGGLKVGWGYRRLHPYGDLLFGRGQINYAGSGYLVPGTATVYTRSVSNVIAAGGGLDLLLKPQWSFKVDAQLEDYPTPVTKSGRIWATSGTLGVQYRFDWKRRRQ